MSHLSWAMEFMGVCAELGVKYLEGEKREEELEKLKAQMVTFCSLENKQQIVKASLLDVEKILKKDKSDSHDINFHEIFNEQMNRRSSKAVDPKKHEKYTAFNKKIEQLIKMNVGDNELAVTGSEMLFIDPITRQRMTDPVRIKKCGHVCDRSSIMSLLKMKQSIKCPIPGCVQSHIRAKDLEEHRELKLQLNLVSEAPETSTQNSIP